MFSFQLRIKTPFRKIITGDSALYFTELKCIGSTQITIMEETVKRHQVIRLLSVSSMMWENTVYTNVDKRKFNLSEKKNFMT